MRADADRFALLPALRLQLRVIGALIIRELHNRFGRDNVGYLWLFIEPALIGVGISALHAWQDTGQGARGVFEFFVVSFTLFFMFRSIFGRAGGAMRGIAGLLYHRHVTLLDLVIARNLLEVAACIVVIAVVQIGIMAWGGAWPDEPFHMIAAVLLIALLAQGMGLCLAALASTSEVVDRLVQPITFLMMPVSGAFFLMQSLPEPVREVMAWVPLVHCFELMREGQFGDLYTYYYDLSYLAIWILASTMLGLALLRGMRSRIGLE
jgi:capsular polysaccharide transport system permease protein